MAAKNTDKPIPGEERFITTPKGIIVHRKGGQAAKATPKKSTAKKGGK